MATISWIGSGSGDWTNPSNWNTGTVPGAGDDVVIAQSGSYTVDITTPVAANSLILNNAGATVLDTGDLALTGAMTLTAGTFNLSTGGTITGGTIIDNSSHLFCAGGTLDGVTYQGQLNLIAGGQSVTIVHGITLSGVGGVGQANINTNHATINLQGTQALDNAQLTLGDSTINVTDPNGAGAVLTIGANTIIGSFNVTTNVINDAGGANDGIVNMGAIQVGAGSITVNGNSFTNDGSLATMNAAGARLTFNSTTLVNNGTISAAGGGILKFADASFTNDGQISISGTTQLIIGQPGSSWTSAGGTIAMSGGVLELDGNFTTANLGTVTGSGGTLTILGNLNNTGGTLATGTGTAFSTLILQGDISNGLVEGPSGTGLVFKGGTLDGVTYQGNIDLSATGASGTILHGITLSGAGGTGNAAIALTGSGSMLSVDGTTTLDNVAINLAGTLASTDQAGTGAVLTLGSNASIVDTGALATISSALNGGDGIVLNGTLTVNNAQSQVLNILTPSLTSTGTITIGSFETINLVNGMPGGTVVNLNGGSFTLGNGSTITGGTIVDGASRLSLPNSCTLDGVTYEGVLDLTGPSDNPHIVNGITLSGVGGVGKATINFTGTGTLDFNGTETLDNATVNFGTNQNGVSDIFANDPQSRGSILTLGSNLVIQQTGNRALIGSSGLNTDGVVNNGVINAGLSTGTMAIDPQNFTNAGQLNVSNGESVDIDATNFTNAAAGTVTAATGATVTIDGTGSWSNAGMISETNATLNLGGNFTTAAIGTINRSGGTINITGKLDNTGATLMFGTGTALGAVNLSGTIKGGTIQSTAGGFTGSASFGGGTLDGATYQGTLDMTATQGALTIINGITLSGAGGVGPATINITGVGASITGKGSQTFDNATINLGTSGNGIASLVAYDPQGTGTILTLGPNLIIQQVGTHAQLATTAISNDGFINQGTINAGVAAGTLTLIGEQLNVGGKFTNSGAINASNGDMVEIGATTFSNTATGTVNVTTGATVTIDGTGSWSNAGMLSETGATLNLGGNFTTAGLGTVNRSGGTVTITGVLDNTDATIAFGAGSTLGAVGLTGTIRNGTIQSTVGGLAPSGSGTLDGVTLQGTLDMSATQASLSIVNGITLTGTGGSGPGVINLTGTGSVLNAKGAQTLDNGTINLGTSGNGTAILYASDLQGKGTTVVTLGPNLVIQQAGTHAQLDGQDIGADGFINQGVINAGISGGSLILMQRLFNVAGKFTNAGAINISNSDSVEIGAATFGNSVTGTINVTTGATLAIDGTASWSSTGSISETGATLTLGGNFNAASLNTVTRSAGTVNLTGAIDNSNATINVGTGTALGAIAFSGTITGGTVNDAGSGLLSTSGTLSGVTYQGTLDLSAQNAILSVLNGTTFSNAAGNGAGTINLTGFLAAIDAKGNQTLDNATINIGAANTSTLFNYGGVVGGSTLTLGPNLQIVQTGTFAAISGTTTTGDNVVNQGVINASLAGGSFIINPLKFTNSGTLIAGAANSVIDLRAANLTNLSGGTLTGGVFQASAGGFIQLINNTTLTTLQADVTESGATAAIRSLVSVSNTEQGIDATLTTIGASGALRLLSGHNLSNANAFTIAGTLQLGSSTFSTGAVTLAAGGNVIGNGTVSAAIANSGLIEANAGTLKLSGAITGAGALQIDAGATLELGSSAADQEGATFTGANGTLIIDTPSAYSGVIGGFGANETIDLKNLAATSAMLSGTTITVTLSAGGTQSYTLAAPLSGGLLVGASSDGNGGTLLTAFHNSPAAGTVAPLASGNNTATTIDFGNTRVGSNLEEELQVTNTAAGPAQALDADIAGTTGAVSASGTISLLSAGQTDQTSLQVTLDSSTAGIQTGSVTVGLSSDGAATGQGVTQLASQTVNVQATIFRLAGGQVAALPQNLIVHVGDTLNEALSVRNTDANDGFSEKLDVSVIGATTGLRGTGTIQLLAAGATNQNGISVGISTASAGSVSGTVQLQFKTDGTGTSGFGAANVGTANVNVAAQVDNYAAAAFTALTGATLTQTGAHSYTLNLGNFQKGQGSVSATFGVKNSATGLADLLAGNFSNSGAAGFSVGGTAAFSGLAAGQSDQNLQATLSTVQAGNFSDTLTLHATGSNASGYSGALSDTTLNIVGKVFGAAQATVNSGSQIDFGNCHVGDIVNQTISVTNSAPAGFSDALDASLSGLFPGVTGTGSITLLTAGSTDSTDIKIGVATKTAGAVSGMATLKLFSDNGTTMIALPSKTIGVSGTVYAYAAPVVVAALNLGAIRVGGMLKNSLNVADGSSANGFQESLDYSAGAAPSGYTLSGTTSGTIASGDSASIGVSLAGTAAGNFSGEKLTLGLTSTGAGTSGLADTALTAQTVTLSGKVYAAAKSVLTTTTVDFGTVHVGQAVTGQTVTIKNGATGALTDVLTGGIGTVSGQFTGSGNLGAGLAAGVSGHVTVGINTTKAGAFTGLATLALHSHDADLSDIAVGAGTVTLKGIVDNYAVAAFEKITGAGTLAKQGANYVLNLGTVAQSSAATTVTIAALNGAAGVADLLAGSFAAKGATTIFTTSGLASFSGLGAGQAAAGIKITFATATSGTFTETITLNGTGSNGSGYNGALAAETLTITGTVLAPKHTYTLTTSADSITGANNDDTVVAKGSTLSAGDAIDGGGGQNMLLLSGGGTFDLRAPTKLVNIQTLSAQEGQLNATAALNHQQTVHLRANLNLTVNVGADPNPNTASKVAESIVIYGAANTDVINLGGGSDTVYLGSAGETVNGGAGTGLIMSTAGLAGAAINGGAGKTTLEITNGGAATLNALDANLTVQLDAATNLKVLNGQSLTVTGTTNVADKIQGTTTALNHLTIDNFAGGKDTLDFSDLTFGKATVAQYVANAGHTGGTLTIGNGTQSAALTLFGQYIAADFHSASDGAAGTMITYLPPAAAIPAITLHH